MDGRVLPHKHHIRSQQTIAGSIAEQRRKQDVKKNKGLKHLHMAETLTEISLAPEGKNTTHILRKRGKLIKVV